MKDLIKESDLQAGFDMAFKDGGSKMMVDSIQHAQKCPQCMLLLKEGMEMYFGAMKKVLEHTKRFDK